MLKKTLIFTSCKFLSCRSFIQGGRKDRKAGSILILGLNRESCVFMWECAHVYGFCIYIQHISLHINPYFFTRIASGVLFEYFVGVSPNE